MMSLLLGGGDFEIRNFNADWIHVLQDRRDRAVFAACVHALEQQDDRVRGIRIQQLLQFAQSTTEFLGLRLRFFFVQSTGVAGVEVLEPNSIFCDDGLGVHRERS